MSGFEGWLDKVRAMKHFTPDRSLPDGLVRSSADAHWLDPAITGNPSRIGVLLEVPSTTMEFYVQELDPGVAGDLQRHRHESVPWVWHRHYNDGDRMVRMLLVENSRLLDALGINERESAGEVSYDDHVRPSE